MVDCKDVNAIYGDTLEKFAVIQWNDFNHGLNTDQRSGHLCFCDNLYKTKGLFAALSREFKAETAKKAEISGRVC